MCPQLSPALLLRIGLLAAAISVWGTFQHPSAQAGADRTSLATRWSSVVRADAVLPEHPRPRLLRETWASLNGTWQYAIRPRTDGRPATWDGEILVPFAVESDLSGVGRRLGPQDRLWYRCTFRVSDAWSGRRVVLRFGAVDWRADVWVNGHFAGEHEGGYDPFAFDVTGLLGGRSEHELVVAVWDPTDEGFQPRGKQVLEPRGIWYTPVSGIWQTVWLEGVPATRILDYSATEQPGGRVRLEVEAAGVGSTDRFEVDVLLDGAPVANAVSDTGAFDLDLGEVRRWSPEDPALYDLELSLLRDGRPLDALTGYFALRTVEIRPDPSGTPRIHLNGSPRFQLGLLDQGYWPDGLYTAPTDEALRYDLEVAKALGFNMVRKHVKTEPERWYTHCDRLGLLVWQDFPSGGPFIGASDPDAERGAQSALAFEREARRIVDALDPYPSIVAWVLFNEGWGQFDTERLTRWLEEHDPDRVVDATSGWADRGVGHMSDMHRYPGPAMPRIEPSRAAVLGEFGGLGLPIAGHTWQDEENWGYRSYTSKDSLVEAYLDCISRLRPLIDRGLAAAVYTQTTDVEIEVNGLLTYDRKVLKLDDPRVLRANLAMYAPPARVETLIPTSRVAAQTWRHTLRHPPAGWTGPEFDDSSWHLGPGGFGTEGTPGAVVGTSWSDRAIWLRRRFVVDAVPSAGTLCLVIHHDEDADVYLNGIRITSRSGYTTEYERIPLDDDTRSLLTPGTNTIAVHCRQTIGGQYIDVGLDLLHGDR